MEYILDANTLIYLVKLNLHEEFIKLIDTGKIIIDSSVYDEVVVKGIKNNYPDAHVAKKFLQQHQISVIPIDISNDLHKFRDAGETSCALLALHEDSNRICITSDIRALKKFDINDIMVNLLGIASAVILWQLIFQFPMVFFFLMLFQKTTTR